MKKPYFWDYPPRKDKPKHLEQLKLIINQTKMKKLKTTKPWVLSLLTGLGLASCVSYFDGEFEELSFTGEIAIPLGYVDYTIGELLEEVSSSDLVIGTNEENVLTFVYSESITAQNGADLISIPDQNFDIDIDPEINMPTPSPIATTQTINKDFDIQFSDISANNEELTMASFNGGKLILELSSTLPVSAQVDILIPSLLSKETGQAYSSTGFVSPDSSVLTFEENLDKYEADLTLSASDSESAFNNIKIETVTTANIRVGDQIQSGQMIVLNVNFTEPKTDKLIGNFKQQEVDVENQTLSFNVFDSFGSGELYFDEPVIRMTFSNSFGIPIGLDLAGIIASKTGEESRALRGTIVDDYQIIAAPSVDNVGESVETTIEITKSNSNINELISYKPDAFEVNLVGLTNPTNGPTQENFVLNNSTVDATVEVEIPMVVSFDQVEISELIEFDQSENLEQVKALTLKVFSENSIPLSGNLRMEFLDASGSVVLTSDQNQVFNAAPVGANGKSSGVISGESEFVFNASDIETITTAKELRVVALLNTYEQGQGTVVKLSGDDQLRLNVSLLTSINANF